MQERKTTRTIVITYNCRCGVKRVLEKPLGLYFDIFHETYPSRLCGNCMNIVEPKYSFYEKKAKPQRYDYMD